MSIIAVYVGYAMWKLLGYSLAALAFRTIHARTDLSAWKVGLARTLLGMFVGGLYTGVWSLLASHGVFHGLPMSGGRGGSILWYLAGLIPVRFCEWGVVIWFFYDRKLERRGRDVLCVLLGTVWSFILDLPMMLFTAWALSSIC
jgi:hypothetical protein